MKLLLYEHELLAEFDGQLKQAKQFHIAEALITLNGLESLREGICASLNRGSHGRVLVGVDMPTDPDAIELLLRFQQTYSGQLELKFFKSSERRILHAKFAVFTDGRGPRAAILGSSNLTRGGLEQNYEANMLISDQKLVGPLLDYFEEHFSGGHSKRITEDWLRAYQLLWSERKKAADRLRTVRGKVRRIGTKSDTGQLLPKRIRGHLFAFTGRIDGWPREAKLYPEVRRLGGEVAPTANGMGKVQCLVHGEILGGRKSTQKLIKARQLSVPVITEEEFFRIMKQEQKLRAGR